jgi:hypothetical protein
VISDCTWARRAARSSRKVSNCFADIVAGIVGRTGNGAVPPVTGPAPAPAIDVQPAMIRSAAARS